MRAKMALSGALLVGMSAACTGGIGEAPEHESPSESRLPMGTPVYALDVSHWSAEITDAEVRCWWDAGVRHVIAGTQNPRITRQQLAMAHAGGMTVDAYVFLYWDQPMATQVDEALEVVQDFPVGRLWLDAEDAASGHSALELIGDLEAAADACGNADCGIYTAGWWWNPATAGSTALSELPLWYAHYDDDPSLESWAWQSFGGWSAPAGKQFQERYVCGVHVDENTMRVEAEPPPAPEPLPDPGAGVPTQPTGMYPGDGLAIHTNAVRMMCDTTPGAAQYAFEIERYNGNAWKTYFTYLSWENSRTFNPIFKNSAYRFRVRGRNPSGWGAWSGWSVFAYGNPSFVPDVEQVPVEPPPVEPPPEEPPPEEPPPVEPPPAGAPVGLSPSGGESVPSTAVLMTCDTMSAATRYAFEIQHRDASSGAFAHYYTYEGSSCSRTFYPVYHNRDYRFRVRAQVEGDWTPDSSWAQFYYE